VTENNVPNDFRTERTMSHWPLLAVGGIVLAFAGFVVGRAYPAHEYQQIGSFRFADNSSTAR
jgi:hypothetical protein